MANPGDIDQQTTKVQARLPAYWVVDAVTVSFIVLLVVHHGAAGGAVIIPRVDGGSVRCKPATPLLLLGQQLAIFTPTGVLCVVRWHNPSRSAFRRSIG